MKTCCFVITLAYFSNSYAEAAQRTLFQIALEKNTVILSGCVLSVRGAVKWSRDTNGGRGDILTYYKEKTDKHISDPQKHYGAQADGMLYLLNGNTSDSGMYYCNGAAAVNLTVVSKNTGVTLRCPESVGGHVRWRRHSGGRDQDVLPASRDTDKHISDAHTPHVSLEDNSLVILRVDSSNAGMYSCYGDPKTISGTLKTTSEPAIVTVECITTVKPAGNFMTTSTSPKPESTTPTIPESTTPTTPETTTPTTPKSTTPTTPESTIPTTPESTTKTNTPTVDVWRVAIALLSIGLLVVTLLFTRRCCSKTSAVRGPPCGEKQSEHVYAEIAEGALEPTTQGAGKASHCEPAIYYLADCPVSPPHPDDVYSLIESFQMSNIQTDTPTQIDPTYSLIN